MSKLPISVVIVIYNEEKMIERCLRSCADVVDEIIVIHDGPCTDRSLDICRQYTDKVLIGERIGEAEPHRVQTYELASNDWVLQLDGDEFLSDELRKQLPALISDPAVQGYDVLWPTLYKGNYLRVYYKRALVNKKFFYFIGAPHENLKPIDGTVLVKRVPYVLEHRPAYDNLTLERFKKKWIPWTRIHAQYYAKDFKDVATFNCSLVDWEPQIRIRIDHPIILGIIGSFVFHVLLGTWNFLKTRQFIFLKSGMLMGLYHVWLYYYVLRAQQAQGQSKPFPV